MVTFPKLWFAIEFLFHFAILLNVHSYWNSYRRHLLNYFLQNCECSKKYYVYNWKTFNFNKLVKFDIKVDHQSFSQGANDPGFIQHPLKFQMTISKFAL